jgi:hypothetical protein
MRPLALALVVLCLCPASGVRADIVTSLAEGQVTANFSTRWSWPTDTPYYDFTPGESVSLTWTYDPEAVSLVTGTGDQRTYTVPSARFQFTTGGGFDSGLSRIYGQSMIIVTDGAVDRLTFYIGDGFNHISLRLADPTGSALSSAAIPTAADIRSFSTLSLMFGRERYGADEGFVATLTPVATSTASVPEPSSLATVGVGTLLALGYAWRRRRTAP